MARNTILFGGTDPGRFAPTYMIYDDSFIPHKDLPIFDQNFDRRDVYLITQNALADPTYLQYIRSQYYRSAETNYDTPFFQEVLRGTVEIRAAGEAHELSAGDAIQFQADAPHTYRNTGAGEAVMYLVMSYAEAVGGSPGWNV